jgi:dipeptidyl aminopeptidase/acylaminoacyl peptidase
MYEWRPGTDINDEARQFDLPTLIGDPKADAAMLDANSPVLQAARIKAPVMLAVGGADRRVPPIHGRKMRDALTKAGRAPEYVEYVDEGHGFYKLENQVDFAQRMETFLARYLK